MRDYTSSASICGDMWRYAEVCGSMRKFCAILFEFAVSTLAVRREWRESLRIFHEFDPRRSGKHDPRRGSSSRRRARRAPWGGFYGPAAPSCHAGPVGKVVGRAATSETRPSSPKVPSGAPGRNRRFVAFCRTSGSRALEQTAQAQRRNPAGRTRQLRHTHAHPNRSTSTVVYR